MTEDNYIEERQRVADYLNGLRWYTMTEDDAIRPHGKSFAVAVCDECGTHYRPDFPADMNDDLDYLYPNKLVWPDGDECTSCTSIWALAY